MKTLQRMLCLLTALILLAVQLPALAQEELLTQQERTEARQLIAMEGGVQGWEKGMRPSADMNALQIQQYLEWLLSDEIGGLLVRIRDKSELLGNQSLQGVEDLLRQFRDQIDYYRDRLETGRQAVYNELYQLENNPELTQREKRRLSEKTREYIAEMRTIIGTVARYDQQYEENVASHEGSFLQTLQGADTPDGAITRQATEKLLAEAKALTEEEQAHIDGQNGVDFSVVTLSTKQFGFIIRDHKGKLLKDAKVAVQIAGSPTSQQTVTTGEDGLASFLVADFLPTSNRRVTVDVTVTHSQHNIREMRRLTLRGGQAEIIRLEQYNGIPYLRMACYNGSDIVVQQNTIYYTAKNNAQQTISVIFTNPGKKVLTGSLYLIYQTYDEKGNPKETEEVRKFTTGEAVSFTDEYCRKIVPGSTVSLRAEIPSTGYSRTFQTQLKVERAYVEEPVFNNKTFINFTPGALSLQFPSDIPFIGGLQMNLGLPGVPSQLVIDPSGYVQYAYGKTFESEELHWKTESEKDKTERMDEAARQSQRDASAISNQVYQNKGSSVSSRFLGDLKASVTPFAALQGRITQVQTTTQGLKEKLGMKGMGGVQAAFKGGYTYPFMVWAIPCYAAMDFTFSLGTSFNVGFTADWPSLSNPALDFGTGVTIAILAELGVSAGMGVKDLLSIAVRFYGNIKPLLRINNRAVASVTLGFGLELTAQMLLLKMKKTLWNQSWSGSAGGNGVMSAAASPDAENGASLTALSAGVNLPEKKTLPAAGAGRSGVFPLAEEQLFKQTDALAQEIQYVTLESDSEKATFGLWLTPTGQQTGRQAKLIWYNLDDPTLHGEIYPAAGGDAQRGPSGTASDYAFAVMGHQDMAAVNVLSGVFADGQERPAQSAMTLAVLRLKNGSLAMEKYAPQVTETPNAGRYLASPVLHFTRHSTASAAPVWFLNAACVREDIASGEITAVHSVDLDQTDTVYQVTVDPLPDGIENVQGLRRMTAATPTSVTFSDNAASGTDAAGEPSLSCYYWLNERRQLSIHLNKTKRALDENVVFMENMVEYNVNDAREFVFYLKEGTADDGSACYRLMGATRQGLKEFTLRDYDVCLYAQRFQTVHVNDGSQYGIHYLYWTENIVPAPDDPEQEERYRVRCVRFDRATNTMSAPFTLVELSHYPASIHLLLDGTGYYTTDLEAADALADSAVNSRRLIRFQYELKIAAQLKGAASSDPCVTAGESAGLLFSVENTGNLPISRFGVIIKQGNTVVQQIVVNCQDPKNSFNSVYASNGPGYSVTRLENAYEDMNGDRWRMTTVADNGQTTETAIHTDLLMPGGVHTYEAAIEIPDDWNGTVSLTAELENLYAMTQYASLLQGSAAVQANGPADAAQYEVCALPSGEVTGRAVANAPGTIGVGRGNTLTDDTVKEIGVGLGDLMMDCQPYVDADGAEYVRVSIVGRSQTDSVVAPTLTATLDGQTVLSHTFKRAIDRDFGYTLDLPAELLLAGKDSGDVTFLLTDNETGNEFSDFDNERTVSLCNELRFLHQPGSLSLLEGEEAVFSVALAGGKQPYAYRWQRMDANGKWTDIPGAIQAEYRIAAVQMKDNAALFRCVVQDHDGCSLTSEAASLAVFSAPPTTGDPARPALWALLLLVCTAGWLWSRRKKG